MEYEMKDEITMQDIDRLAELSALNFSAEDKAEMMTEISNIIKMLNDCDKVDTSDYVYDNLLDLGDLRNDTIGESLTNSEALINAPKQRKGYFNVPKVVE